MSVQKVTRFIMAFFVFAAPSVLFLPIPGMAADGINWKKVIDYGDAGYSETGNAWRTYTHHGHDGSYRYLSHWEHTQTRKGTATWTTAIPYSGTYRVSVSYRRTENRSPDADFYATNSAGGSDHFSISQVGDNELFMWKTLGEYHYKKGQVVKVILDGTDDTYSDCADAASWELVELDPPIGLAVYELLMKKKK